MYLKLLILRDILPLYIYIYIYIDATRVARTPRIRVAPLRSHTDARSRYRGDGGHDRMNA